MYVTGLKAVFQWHHLSRYKHVMIYNLNRNSYQNISTNRHCYHQPTAVTISHTSCHTTSFVTHQHFYSTRISRTVSVTACPQTHNMAPIGTTGEPVPEETQFNSYSYVHFMYLSTYLFCLVRSVCKPLLRTALIMRHILYIQNLSKYTVYLETVFVTTFTLDKRLSK